MVAVARVHGIASAHAEPEVRFLAVVGLLDVAQGSIRAEEGAVSLPALFYVGDNYPKRGNAGSAISVVMGRAGGHAKVAWRDISA